MAIVYLVLISADCYRYRMCFRLDRYARPIIVLALMSIAALGLSSPRPVVADSNLSPHAPIVINGDADFTSANGVTGGTGTASDPYIIQGWDIMSCCNLPGILIRDTSAYFVVRNVYVHSNDLPAYGINATNVVNGVIEDSQFHLYFSGITLDSTDNFVVQNITNGGVSRVYVTNSTQVRVSDDYGGADIIIKSSDGVWVSHNNLNSIDYIGSQISVSSSNNVSVLDNLYYSISLGNSSNVTVSGNNLGADCCTTDFTGLTIENSDQVTVSSNYFYSDWGIVVLDSGFLEISDNHLSFTSKAAIILRSCSDISIQRNQVNTAGGYNGGIVVESCARINIFENSMSRMDDICCQRAIDLLTVSLSSNVTIVGNNLVNSTTAIGVSDASYIIINGNNVQSNVQGVVLNDTMNVQVFHNNFLNNIIQAIDTNGTNNSWNNYPNGGNFWSDYTGVDNCSGPDQDMCPGPDGLGDTPYVFNHNRDYFPLMTQYSVSWQPTSNVMWMGYDWDGGGEETLTLNGQFVVSLPATDTPQNGGAWTIFYLNITSFVVQGTNTLTFTHANWDCGVSDDVASLQLTRGTALVYSGPSPLPLSCTQSVTYTFTV